MAHVLETVQVVQVVKKSQPKKGKGGSDAGGKKTKRGGRKRVQCHNCGGDHFLRDCKEWKEIKETLNSSSGNWMVGPLRPYGRVTGMDPPPPRPPDK